MKLGLFSMNMGVRRKPDGLVATAQAAEAAGFDSVWAGEHVVLPNRKCRRHPWPPRIPPSTACWP